MEYYKLIAVKVRTIDRHHLLDDISGWYITRRDIEKYFVCVPERLEYTAQDVFYNGLMYRQQIILCAPFVDTHNRTYICLKNSDERLPIGQTTMKSWLEIPDIQASEHLVP